MVFCIALQWPESLAEGIAGTAYGVLEWLSSIVHDAEEFLLLPTASLAVHLIWTESF